MIDIPEGYALARIQNKTGEQCENCYFNTRNLRYGYCGHMQCTNSHYEALFYAGIREPSKQEIHDKVLDAVKRGTNPPLSSCRRSRPERRGRRRKKRDIDMNEFITKERLSKLEAKVDRTTIRIDRRLDILAEHFQKAESRMNI